MLMSYVPSLRQEENQAQETANSPPRSNPEQCPWLGWAAWWQGQEGFLARGLCACCWKKRRLWLRSGCWTKPSALRPSAGLTVSAIPWDCAAAGGAAVPRGQLGNLYLSSETALQIEVLAQGILALSLPFSSTEIRCKMWNQKGFLSGPEASVYCSRSKQAVFNLTPLTTKPTEQN